jgi:hypothetical protein
LIVEPARAGPFPVTPLFDESLSDGIEMNVINPPQCPGLVNIPIMPAAVSVNELLQTSEHFPQLEV